jgi:hypothetical protein
MRKALWLAVLVIGAAIPISTASADIPGQTPFPSQKVADVFAAAQTATTDGAINDFFAPGSTVVFRAYAVDNKSKKILQSNQVKYFYVKIPSQPNVKLKYDPNAAAATSLMPWTASWTVPSSYPMGVVDFKVMIKTTGKLHGQFVQMPVPSSQLTIVATTVPPVFTPSPAPAKTTAAASGTFQLSLYVDTVNGTKPAGAAPRPVGCTQTNTFKRGEQLVVRAWGADLASGGILSSENVTSAAAQIQGQPDVTLNWGAHGSPNKVYYWTGAWNIPADYPLGDMTIHVVYKTDGNKTGVEDYPVVIIP